MIAEVDPLLRLEILGTYMNYWVDNFPNNKYTFHQYFKRKYPHLIPGTVDHAKEIATHCYYCNVKLSPGHSNPNRSSIDHYLPKSVGKTERYVICCAHCNTKKGSMTPDELVSRFTNAHLKSREMWGFHGKKLKQIAEQIQVIANDILYNMGPKIYYVKR